MLYFFRRFLKNMMQLLPEPDRFMHLNIRAVGQNHPIHPIIDTVGCPYKKITVFFGENFLFPEAVINTVGLRSFNFQNNSG